MEKGLKELIEVSQLYGKNKAYVIAGGGNTSFKNDKLLWIKASGSGLDTIDEKGFVSLSREKLAEIATKTYSQDSTAREAEVKDDLHAAIVAPKDKRPSVETSMHDSIAYSYVVHTHPTKVNGLMCAKNGKAICDELFGDEVIFIPYTDPGYILFKKVDKEIKKYTVSKGYAPKIIFLENHGVFVADNDVEAIKQMYVEIEAKLDAYIKKTLPSDAFSRFATPVAYKVAELHPDMANMVAISRKSDLISAFVKNAEVFKKADTAFTPDAIVYCKAHYLLIPTCQTDEQWLTTTQKMVGEFKDTYGYLPKVIALEGQGIVAVEDSEKSAKNVLEVFEDVLKISFYSENFGGPQFMTPEQIEFIDNWEVENYRRKMAKS